MCAWMHGNIGVCIQSEMDKRTDGWMMDVKDGCKGCMQWMDGQTNKETKKQTNKQTNKSTNITHFQPLAWHKEAVPGSPKQ